MITYLPRATNKKRDNNCNFPKIKYNIYNIFLFFCLLGLLWNFNFFTTNFLVICNLYTEILGLTTKILVYYLHTLKEV